MPTLNDPPRRIGTAVPMIQDKDVAANRSWGAFNGIAPATITEVRNDGTFFTSIGGPFSTTGIAQKIAVGDIVEIGWAGGEPRAIISHTAKKAQGITPPPDEGPIVEMLLAAPTEEPSSPSHFIDKLDIWFRNATQTTLLDCRSQIEAAGHTITDTTLSLVPNAWSQSHRSFLVGFTDQATTHPMIAIFDFDGDEDTPITETASATLRLPIIDLASLTGIGLGTISWTQNVLGGGSVSTAINLGTALSGGYSIFVPTDPFHNIIQTAFATIFNAVLTRDDHLILSVNLSIGNTVAGGGTNVRGGFNYPYIIDITNGTIYFNGITQQGIWPTTIYNGAAFVQVGAGFYDETGTGTNAWEGGAQFYMVPDANENFLRVFVGLRAFYTGGNPSLAGKIQQQVQVRDLATSISAILFPLTTYASGERSHFALLSNNGRYVMWMRSSPGPLNSPDAFSFPSATTLGGYDFKEGVHITDLGADALTATVTDYIPLTSLANIETFLDSVPYLQEIAAMWSDYNDLRTTTDTGRTAPQFVVFRKDNASGTDQVVIVPFTLPLDAFEDVDPDISTMETLSPDDNQFIADFVNNLYLNSGHADMVTGFAQFASPNSIFVCVQTLPIDGVGLPDS